MPGVKKSKLVREKGGRRGLVPSREFGRLDLAYGSYLTGLDPLNRPEVQLALALSPDSRFREFLARIGVPLSSGVVPSLQATAKACAIGLEEFNDWWSKASTQKAIALCQVQSVSLTQDLIDNARSKTVGCEVCDGLGWIPAPDDLPPDTPGYRIRRMSIVKTKDTEGKEIVEEVPVWCRACPARCSAGTVRKPGDEFSMEKSLEIAGLINKKGPGISLVQHFGGQSMGAATSRLNDVMTIDIDPADPMDRTN